LVVTEHSAEWIIPNGADAILIADSNARGHIRSRSGDLV
jgi:hypothetical protein